MLERETELIRQIILESTIGGRSSIRLNEVIASPLPRGVKSFMSAAVAELLEAEFNQSSSFSRITKNTNDLVLPDRAVLNAFAMEYVLERDEFIKLAEDAVHFLENYLCRPQWTLTQMLFANEAAVSLETMAKTFARTTDYSYYGGLAQRYAQRNGWTTITRDQFEHLIARIDEEIVKQHSPKQIALLAQPIFDYLLFGNISMTRPVPLAAILLFYEDKKLAALKDYIERICHVRSRTQISMGELIEIIEDLHHVESTVKDDVQKSENAIFAARETEQPATQEVDSEQIKEPSTSQSDSLSETGQQVESVVSAEQTREELQPAEAESVDANSEMNSDRSPETPMVVVPENDTPEVEGRPDDEIKNTEALVAYAAERETQRHALFLTFPDRPVKSVHSSDLPPIEQVLSDLQQEKFEEIIFGNNPEHCRAFLTSINNTSTWAEAQLLLRKLFEMRNLNILSQDVVEFTDVMHARYYTELKPAE